MKKADRSSKKTRNFDLLVSKLSENKVLNQKAMNSIRGGDEGSGGVPIIIVPKP